MYSAADETEGVAGGGLGCEPFQTPFACGVLPVRQKLLGGLALFARIRKRDDRIRAEGEDTLLAEVAVLQPPEHRAVGLDEDVEAAAVGNFERFGGRFRVADIEMRQRHRGYRPPALGVTFPNLPPFLREAMRRHVTA